MEGHRALGFYHKYLNLCSEDEQSSYGFGMTLFIFGWTIPLNILGSIVFFFCSIIYYFSIVFQVWIMWVMKTSCLITPLSKFLSSMSCLNASSCLTSPKVTSRLVLLQQSIQTFTDQMFLMDCIYTVYLDPPFTARDTLRAWQEKNHPWLELSDVHRETTENIRVTVIPFYMGMRVRTEGCYVLQQFLIADCFTQTKCIRYVL